MTSTTVNVERQQEIKYINFKYIYSIAVNIEVSQEISRIAVTTRHDKKSSQISTVATGTIIPTAVSVSVDPAKLNCMI